MKRCIVVILSLLVLAQSVSVLAVYAGFYANRDYIAKNLCVNRNMENSICEGQCVLMKKLKAAQEQQQEDFLQQLPSISAYVVPQFERFEPKQRQVINPENNPSHWTSEAYAFQFYDAIFRPPLGKA